MNIATVHSSGISGTRTPRFRSVPSARCVGDHLSHAEQSIREVCEAKLQLVRDKVSVHSNLRAMQRRDRRVRPPICDQTVGV